MPQSLANLHTHLIFSTKERFPFLHASVRPDLHAYVATVMANLKCPAIMINSVEDHVHILFRLGRTIALAKVVEDVKKSSSKWIKTQGNDFKKFAWQSGYGAFSVSESNVTQVEQYIRNQEEHHQKKSFQDEYREFLRKNNVEFNEQYLWD